MMVNESTGDFSVVALQIDHSRVAGYLAAHWGNSDFAPLEPYEAMVLATQEHDNGWWAWEIAPTMSDDGRPLDYIGSIAHLGDGVWLDLARKGAAKLLEVNKFAALMAQMHAEGLLDQAMGLIPRMMSQVKRPGVEQFLAEGKSLRAQWVAELSESDVWAPYVTEDALWTNYKYLEVFDQLAQYICNRYPLNSTLRTTGPGSDLSKTPVPVRPGEPDVGLTVDVIDETRAYVDPYPFDVDVLKVSFPARLMPNQAHLTHGEFLRAFYRAERVGAEYTLMRRP